LLADAVVVFVSLNQKVLDQRRRNTTRPAKWSKYAANVRKMSA